MEKEIVKEVAAIALTVAKAKNELKALTDEIVQKGGIPQTPQAAKEFGQLRWAGYSLEDATSRLNKALDMEA